jgi:hypothetical protein
LTELEKQLLRERLDMEIQDSGLTYIEEQREKERLRLKAA